MSYVVLLLSCPDRPGIVAAVTGWVASSGGNIVDAQQHTDSRDGMFFQRVKFVRPDGVPFSALEDGFRSVASKLGLTYKFCSLPNRPRTALLVSRHVHCMSDLLCRAYLKDLDLDVRFVASDTEDGRDICGMFGHPFVHIPVGSGVNARDEQETRLLALLNGGDLDLVILARYMRVLSSRVVEPWFGRMINIHHSFLPSFVGAGPYRQAHDRGVKIVGATAHYVSEVLDAGPIIAQDVVRVSHRDDVSDLTRRGRDVEVNVLASAVRAHVEHRVLIFQGRTVVFD